MADLKISQLTAITTLTPATDVLPVVDVTGTTKKITTNQLLGSGGTATLASATITGDLTAARLIVTGGTIPTNGLWLPTTNTLEFAANSLAQYRIAPLGVFSWYDGAGGTRMTLNASGLGVGASPVVPLHIFSGGTGTTDFGNVVGTFRTGASGRAVALQFSDTSNIANIGMLSGALQFAAGGSTKQMTLDTSGNVGVGVTPSASGGCLQLKSGITFPATQVASSDANTLDDYEEGNWTPTVGDASSGGNQATTATAVGRYTKIGRLVTVQWEVTDINTTGLTAGNAVYIRGLPFASSSATTQFGTTAVTGVTFSGYLSPGIFNGSSFPIYSSSSGGSLADIKVSALASGTADIWGTLTYIV
jgi:hypothetical protein